MGKNFYLEVILKERKYIFKGKKITRYITHDLEISPDDSYKENSYEED